MKYGSCEEGESTPLKGGCPDETNDGIPATGASADKKKVFVAMAVAFVVGVCVSAMGVTSKNFMAAQLVNLKKHRHDDASYYTDDYFYGHRHDDASYYTDDYFYGAPASSAEDDGDDWQDDYYFHANGYHDVFYYNRHHDWPDDDYFSAPELVDTDPLDETTEVVDDDYFSAPEVIDTAPLDETTEVVDVAPFDETPASPAEEDAAALDSAEDDYS